MKGAYIINVLIIIANVIELDLIIVSRPEGVCLIDFGCKKEDGGEESVRKYYTIYVHESETHFYCIVTNGLLKVTEILHALLHRFH